MTVTEFRALALGLPGVTEASHQGHADFRVRGKIFATLGYPDETCGMVRLAPDEQARWVQKAPAVLAVAKGSWGQQGSTLVRLEPATAEIVRPALQSAWERVVREETAAALKQGARKHPVRAKRKKI